MISLGASHHRTGFVYRQVHSPAFSRLSAGRPGYKYDNTRGASGSKRNNPFRDPPSPSLASLALSLSLSRRVCRKELILIDRHVLLVVFFRRFTILEIRKRELNFHHPLTATRHPLSESRVPADPICIRRSRRGWGRGEKGWKGRVCKSIGAIVP